MKPPRRTAAALVPELDVTDLDESLRFYVDVVGFGVVFERDAERFAYLAREDAELMLPEAAGPGRRFRTAPLKRPFGRGVNLQIAVGDVDAVSASVLRGGLEPILPIEERWYEVEVVRVSGRWDMAGPMRTGNRQFVVADPDGYLLRIITGLGVEPR